MIVAFDNNGSKRSSKVTSILSYIGSSAFHISSTVTRRYDLDSATKVGPYLSAIARRMSKESNLSLVMFEYDPAVAGGYTTLADFAEAVMFGSVQVNKRNSFPAVWANSPWGSTTVLNPGGDMASQMKSNDADLLLQALNASGTAAGPASEPPEPKSRVAEADPTNNDIAPHRRSVIRNQRDPKTYIVSLLK